MNRYQYTCYDSDDSVIGSPHIQSEGVVDGDGFPCPRGPWKIWRNHWLRGSEHGPGLKVLLYLVCVFVLKIWNLLTPNKPMLDLVFVNSGHIHLSAPNKSNMIKQPNSKWIPCCLIRGMDCFFCAGDGTHKKLKQRWGPWTLSTLGQQFSPWNVSQKTILLVIGGILYNPIPSMFLPCSCFFHRDCHSFALEMDLLRQIYQHKLWPHRPDPLLWWIGSKWSYHTISRP